jgi:hypothetical protein
MTMRTSSTTVTFTRPFLLSGIDGVQPAGTYTVETDGELLQALSFPAYRRVATLMFLPSPPGGAASAAGLARVADIDPGELQAALTRDASVEQEPAVAVAPDGLPAEAVVPQPTRSVGSTSSGLKARVHDLMASVRRLRGLRLG